MDGRATVVVVVVRSSSTGEGCPKNLPHRELMMLPTTIIHMYKPTKRYREERESQR